MAAEALQPTADSAPAALLELLPDLDRLSPDMSNAVTGVRASFDQGLRSALDPWTGIVPNLLQRPPLLQPTDVLVLREQVNTLLLELRIWGIGLLLLSAAVAVVVGQLNGDQSQIDYEEICAQEDERGMWVSTMPPRRAAMWDMGIDDELATDECPVNLDTIPRRDVSAGLWLELVLCVALDIAGDASYFYPTFGEASDLIFAFVYAFVLELLFSWPALAIFAFWEEALPVTDLIPSATITWVLVISGVRTELQRKDRDKESEEAREEAFFQVQLNGPLADRRAFQPPEPYLQPGNAPWEESWEESEESELSDASLPP